MESYGSEALMGIRQKLKEYLEQELLPMEAEKGLTPETEASRVVLQGVWKRSRELGFYGIHLPKELGGKGLHTVDLCLLKEDLAASGSVLFLHVLGEMGGPLRVGDVIKYATPDQMENFFLPVIKGDKATCFAVTEPDAGSDVTRIQTRAVKDGEYFVTKGDNNLMKDDVRIRREDISYIVAAIIY